MVAVVIRSIVSLVWAAVLSASRSRLRPGLAAVTSLKMLPTKFALRVSQSLFARLLVAGTVGCARPYHGHVDRLYLLLRQVTKFVLGASDRARRRLTMHRGCRTLSSGRPGSS